jgi:hypothetical protein
MRARLLATLVLLVLALPASAIAQSPADDVYNPLDSRQETPGASSQSGDSHGGLPFTGTDVAIFGGAGLLLVGTGVGIRRASRSR